MFNFPWLAPYLSLSSLFWLAILIIDVWAIISIVSGGQDPIKKTLWVVLVLILPVIGVLLWYLLGR